MYVHVHVVVETSTMIISRCFSRKETGKKTHLKGLSRRQHAFFRFLLNLAQAVQTVDSAIHWINHSPLDNSIGFASVYRLDSDLSG